MKIRAWWCGAIPALLSWSPLAAANPRTPQELIKAQLGCFEVTFQYEEQEAHQPDYTLAPDKTSQILELVVLEEDTEDRIVLQHILVTPPMIKPVIQARAPYPLAVRGMKFRETSNLDLRI